MTELELSTNMHTITKLYQLCEGRKKTLTVHKDVLSLILMDHTRMYNALVRNTDLDIVTPPEDNDYYDGYNEKGVRVAKRPRVHLKTKEKPKKSPPPSNKKKRVRLGKPKRVRL